MAEALVRARMGESMTGYINLLRLSAPRQIDALYAYTWGDEQLLTSSGDDQLEGLFELSSIDIILFKSRPEAIGARNLAAVNRKKGLLFLYCNNRFYCNTL